MEVIRMVYLKKTGRLIAKRRKEMNLTRPQLSELLHVSPLTVSRWEEGTLFPDFPSESMIYKVMGLNPVELVAGAEMHDDKLKNDISAYMSKMVDLDYAGGNDVCEDLNET